MISTTTLSHTYCCSPRDACASPKHSIAAVPCCASEPPPHMSSQTLAMRAQHTRPHSACLPPHTADCIKSLILYCCTSALLVHSIQLKLCPAAQNGIHMISDQL